jgi:hypothetical protein
MTLDPRAICAVLTEEGVEFVVIGGFAAVARGAAVVTYDIDVIAARAHANLERLARALRRIGAQLRTGTEVLPLDLSADFLGQMQVSLNLTTNHGDLDLVFSPAGPKSSYEQWIDGSTSLDLGDSLVVEVAHWQTSSRRNVRLVDLRI